jgi:hypothetical protein
MLMEFCVRTQLTFDDEVIEGQCLHVGDEQSCRRVAEQIPAVSISDARTITDSRLIVEKNTMCLQPGQIYAQRIGENVVWLGEKGS